MDDDDRYIGYIPSTIDPGYSLLVATTIFCVLTNLMLPCLVSLGRRYEKRRIAKFGTGEEDDVLSEQAQPKEGVDAFFAGELKADDEVIEVQARKKVQVDDTASVAPSSFVHGKVASNVSGSTQQGKLQTFLDKIVMPPYPDDVDSSVVGGSAFAAARQRKALSTMSTVSAAVSTTSTATFLSKASTTVLDTRIGKSRRRALRRQRHALLDPKLRQTEGEKERMADIDGAGADHERQNLLVDTNHEATTPDEEEAEPATSEVSQNQSPSEVASRVSSHVSSRISSGSGLRGRSKNRDGSAVSGVSSGRTKRARSPEQSVLGRLDDHVITPNDAADAHDPGNYLLGKPGMEGDAELDLCCGKHAWWQASMISAGFDRIVALSEYDREMRRVVKLSVPYSASALLTGILETATVAIVAQYLGTQAVAAYTLVELLLGLTSEFFGGIIAAEGTLCSHAVGADNYKLAGQYVQLSAILYTICLIPNIIFWMFLLDDVIGWFGFNEEVVEIGYQYGIVVLFHEWLVGMGYAYHSLLDVIDYEDWSTIIGAAEELVDVIVILAVVTNRETSLQEIGLIELAVGVVFFVFNCWYTVYKGWMNDYLEGMVGSCALANRSALMNVVTTATPLAFGYLLQYGEWEILTIFAASMGPAEVATWGIVGTLWEMFETLTEGIADAGEVRCAFHLGAGNPQKAKISSYKTILISIVSSCVFTGVLFILGENIALWLTPDVTLQSMIIPLLPLLGIGNVTLTAGGVCWALVGAQGRYRLATFVAFVTTWGISLPLAALFTYGLNFDLQGIASGVVIGYSVTGTTLLYILLRSDWERLSKILVEQNAESDSDDSSDEEDEDNEEAEKGEAA